MMKEKIGFIGSGHLAQSLIEGWLRQSLIAPADIVVSNRTPGKPQRLQEAFGVTVARTNEELVDQVDIVLIATKPQDLEVAIEPIASSFGMDQIVISLAAGFELRRLKRLLPGQRNLVRVMANTPAQVGRGVFGYCTPAVNLRADSFMERMFKPLGLTIKLDEGEPFEACAVGTSAGVGFVFELMLYWQEWLEERGISAGDAQAMTTQTFLGAAELAAFSEPQTIADLQGRVTSKKGITAAGLASMRELEIERLLRYSFEKSAMRDRELAK